MTRMYVYDSAFQAMTSAGSALAARHPFAGMIQ
ncbi:MAG: hypothetical protein JWO83_2685 [Caulobacteraceae bacterium]|jgi:hypothetical protein|nr:hypothetical protein [Caulobacteraceae bacterium]